MTLSQVGVHLMAESVVLWVVANDLNIFSRQFENVALKLLLDYDHQPPLVHLLVEVVGAVVRGEEVELVVLELETKMAEVELENRHPHRLVVLIGRRKELLSNNSLQRLPNFKRIYEGSTQEYSNIFYTLHIIILYLFN